MKFCRRTGRLYYGPYYHVFKEAPSSGCSGYCSCRGGSQEEIYKDIRTGRSVRRLCSSHRYVLEQKIKKQRRDFNYKPQCGSWKSVRTREEVGVDGSDRSVCTEWNRKSAVSHFIVFNLLKLPDIFI